ncbi:hypothetical protein [Clavibacter capsici]|uniref:hypothetical protein n=1 Tax=Clavibacter capsici TaxID=1874630 RepID=UPI00293F06F6|nr:hypothetical protein [Clavibacter capsici]
MSGTQEAGAPQAAAAWRPRLAAGAQVGPARWDGQQVLTDVSVAGQERILRVGLRERMVLDLVDGTRTVPEMGAEIARQGLPLPEQVVGATVNRLLAFGLVERPFAMSAPTLDAIDRRAAVGADNLSEVWAVRGGSVRNPFGFLAATPVLVLLAAVGIVAVVVGWTSADSAWAAVLAAPPVTGILPALAIAIAWSCGVTLLHEGAHVGTFRALSGRRARLSVTRLGVVPLMNTQLDGLALLSRGRRFRVVASGPVVSMALVSVPCVVLALASPGSFLEVAAATALLVDLLVVSLAVSFLPNTDGTRLLEVVASVDQLQAVAFRTLTGRYARPRGLPLVTRVVVVAYPFLLVAAVVSLLLAGASALAPALT